MENNLNNEILAVKEVVTQKRICKCCGKELPITMFNKRGTGYRNICIVCERGDNGASEKFKQFTNSIIKYGILSAKTINIEEY